MLIELIKEQIYLRELQFPDGNEVLLKLTFTVVATSLMLLQFPDGNEVLLKKNC